ncbi:putative peptidoglycan glycosyltransferase FtsW [Trichinella spiralis]|uniref:Peptidoglycan glycosyltransferase FtsW n=1 Tax=Trichinella spiralis TaxID=6334 RepID=A0ABR3K3N4_TRISP
MACIPIAVKDQGAASDESHGHAQCSEPSAKSLTHHNFFKHKNICQKHKQAEMDPMNSWHMTCLTLAYLLLAQQSILSVFIRFITSSTWAFMCSKGMPAGQLIAICLTGDLKDSAENPAEETMKKFWEVEPFQIASEEDFSVKN